jgi:hypothetical protein
MAAEKYSLLDNCHVSWRNGVVETTKEVRIRQETPGNVNEC